MSRLLAALAAVALVALWACPAQAQLLADTSRKVEAGSVEVGVVGGMSSVSYESKKLEDGDMDRTLGAGYAAFGVNDMIDVYGALGYILKVEPEDWKDEGTGYILAGGGRWLALDNDPFRLFAYGEFRYLSEDYGKDNGTKAEATQLEVAGGGTAVFAVNEAFSVHGGIELVPYSDATVTVDPRNGKSKDYDSERDGVFVLRGGAEYGMDNWWLRAELGVITEVTFFVGAGIGF